MFAAVDTKKYSLILGGTAGLGAEIYKQLSERGDAAIIVGRRSPALLSEKDLFLCCDFSSEKETLTLASRLTELFSNATIDKFFWVTGTLTRAPFTEISSDQVFKMIDVNLRNPLIVARAVWSHMQTNTVRSKFAVVSSSAGVSDAPRDDEAVYAATKAAQVSFARAIGKQNKNPKVSVSLFCPGGMQTGFWDTNSMDKETFDSFLDPAKVAAKIVSTIESQVPLYQEIMIPRGSL